MNADQIIRIEAISEKITARLERAREIYTSGTTLQQKETDAILRGLALDYIPELIDLCLEQSKLLAKLEAEAAGQ